MQPEHRAFLQKHLIPISRDSNVWDFCCGSGMNGIVALKNNARWVTFTDVRQQTMLDWVAQKAPGEVDKTRYRWEYFDADQIDKYLPQVPTQDLDIIIYCGHFYHARNHYEIAKMFTKTQARHLILESKTIRPNAEDSRMTIDWHIESTKENLNTFEESKTHSIVGSPNFKWTKTCFELLGWWEEDSEIIEYTAPEAEQFTFSFLENRHGLAERKEHTMYRYRIKFIRNV